MNYNEIIIRAVEVAYDKKNLLSEIFKELERDNQYELFFFNSVIASSYLLNEKIIPFEEDLLNRYQATFCAFGDKIKKLEPEYLFSLIFDRLENYGEELNLVQKTQFTSNEHFPLYFFRRVYHYPLELEEMPAVKPFDDDFYEGSILLDMYKLQVSEINSELKKVL